MTATSTRPPKLVADREAIRRRRYDLGLNLSRLAALAGISQPYMNRIENGAVPGSPAALKKIADVLEVNVSDITMTEPRPDSG